MEEWGEWCTVRVTVIVSTTAPINKKQKIVGMKYLAKILEESVMNMNCYFKDNLSLSRYL